MALPGSEKSLMISLAVCIKKHECDGQTPVDSSYRAYAQRRAIKTVAVIATADIGDNKLQLLTRPQPEVTSFHQQLQV